MSGRIGIIGAGKVGTSLGMYFNAKGCPLAGFYSKTPQHAEEAANRCHAAFYPASRELVADADLLFLTVPDDAVAGVWEEIRHFPLSGKTVCHTGGLLTSAVFRGAAEAGVKAAAVHVMCAFGERFAAWEQLCGAPLTVEGSGTPEMTALFTACGNRLCPISPEAKAKYHAAGVFASNFMLALLSVSERLLRDACIPPETAHQMLCGLVRGNLDAALDRGVKEALSGPLERGDAGTVRAHLAALDPRERDLYVRLSGVLLDVAKQKNPQRDYRTIEELIWDEADG